MRIGYDTLIENPRRPSSAINFLRTLLWALTDVPGADVVALVSRENAAFFETPGRTLQSVRCLTSNEHILARILVQQLQIPRVVRRERLDVLLSLNQISLAARCAKVVKTCGLHHHLFPEEFGWQGWNLHSLSNPARLAYRRMAWDRSARAADRVIANSECTRTLIADRMRVPLEKIDVVYEAVDDAFVPAADLTA